MKFDNYQVEDFLQDGSFFNWVKMTNKEDIELWEAWWKDNPGHHDEAREAINILKTISFEMKGFNQSEITDIWQRIKEKTIDSQQITKRSSVRKFLSNNFMKVAAVTVPFILGAVLYYLYNNEVTQNQTVFSQQQIVKEIPRGQKLTVYLPDGSMVKLNAESKISYPKPFDKEERVVTLNGEAFFEVTRDPQRPFRVISGGIETRVIGTSFNIKAYSDEDRVKVAVVSGKVSIEKVSREKKNANTDFSSESIVLSPSEQVTYYVENNKTVVSGYNPNEVLGWSEGTLYFNNASMEEFVSKLERWYGIDIIVKREIPIKKGIVGEFRNQSLEEILMGMHASSEFDYEFENGKLIIK